LDGKSTPASKQLTDKNGTCFKSGVEKKTMGEVVPKRKGRIGNELAGDIWLDAVAGQNQESFGKEQENGKKG